MNKQQPAPDRSKSILPARYKRRGRLFVALFFGAMIVSFIGGITGNTLLFPAASAVAATWALWRYHLHLTAYIAAMCKNYALAEKLVDRGIAKYPNDLYLYELGAAVKMYACKPEAALQLCNHMLSKEPEHPNALNLQTTANFLLGNYDLAIENATKTIALQPKNLNAYVNRMAAYIGKFDYKNALNDAAAILEIAPTSIVGKLNRAVALLKMNDRDNALCDLKDAIELSKKKPGQPYLPNAFTLRACIYSNEMLLDRALSDCDRALQASPNFAEAYLVRAIALTKARQFADARQTLEKFWAIPSQKATQAPAIAASSRLYLAEGTIDQALSEANRALETMELPETLSTYALAKSRNGEHDEALTLLNRAIELDPYDAESFHFRAEVLSALGQTERAQQDRKIASDFGYRPYL